MPAQAFYKGSFFNSPIFYDRVLNGLKKVDDIALERISFLIRYLYSQEIKRYHYYEKYPNLIPSGKTLADYIVSGALSATKTAGDGKINIGFVTDSVRDFGISVSPDNDNLAPPPGADISRIPFPGLVFSTTNTNLYQYSVIPSQILKSNLNSSSYFVYDDSYFSGSLRISGGRREQDLTHTIVFDSINQLDKGDGLGSYFIASSNDLDPNTGQPSTAGDPGTWFDCGSFFQDTLFDPQNSLVYPTNSFQQVSIDYNLWVKTDLDNVTFSFPSSIKGFLNHDSNLDNAGALQEFYPDFSISEVYFNNSSGVDTLHLAPSLYKDVLLPIFRRYYPIYTLGTTDPGVRNRKGRIFDNYYEKSESMVVLNNSVYTKIAEPKFQDELGNFYGSNQNYLRIKNTYFLKTDILFT
tara:strand:- start:13996 stop:15222 length:1227 start_codon:yes stop_codon:yes gene_type:complete